MRDPDDNEPSESESDLQCCRATVVIAVVLLGLMAVVFGIAYALAR